MKKLLTAFILSLYGITITFAVPFRFSDHDQLPEFAKFSIEKLREKGIISGNSDGSFAPERSVNRAEFCKMLVNATKVQKYLPLEPNFPDVETDDWFFEYVETAKYHGWIKGYPDGTFRPGGNINRAEISKILVRAFGFDAPENTGDKNWFDKYVRVLKLQKLNPFGVVSDFTASKKPSRSEIAEQIFRFMKKTGRISPLDLVDEPKLEEPELTTDEPGEPMEETTPPETPTSQDTSPPIDTNLTTSPFIQEIDTTSGNLYITKTAGTIKKSSVEGDQKNVTAMRLIFEAKEAPVEISALQFRRIGNGSYTDFSQAWIEADETRVSSEVTITDDIITIPLESNILIETNTNKEIILRISLSGTGESGNSSRYVLYLPEWIGANTETKVGFFPFGGIDLEIK